MAAQYQQVGNVNTLAKGLYTQYLYKQLYTRTWYESWAWFS